MRKLKKISGSNLKEFSALEKFDDNVDIRRAWEIV
jgi:hypothetical protein